jgi:hypothetical protein
MISSVYLSTMLRHSLCTGALQTKTTVIVLQKCSTMKETPTDRIFYGTGGANYVPYSCLLISNKFCNGGSGPSRAKKFLYAPAPPPPSVWALKPPLWALVHKTTYAPRIYTALCIMFWMRAYPLLGKWEGGWVLEILGLYKS